jgi:hypothetical protein
MSLTHVVAFVTGGVLSFASWAAGRLGLQLLWGLIRLPFTKRIQRGFLNGTPDAPNLPRGDRREDGTPFRTDVR